MDSMSDSNTTRQSILNMTEHKYTSMPSCCICQKSTEHLQVVPTYYIYYYDMKLNNYYDCDTVWMCKFCVP